MSWNDTVRMAMLCDLVYGPYLAKAPAAVDLARLDDIIAEILDEDDEDS